MAQAPKPAGPPPGRAQLHEAALRHLARFATTESGLVRVLERSVQRWGRRAEAEGQEVAAARAAAYAETRVVARALVEAGLVDDAVFATARAARLVRSGRSRRGVEAHLVGRGVGSELAHSVLPGPEQELSAAVAYARRRRLGPFRVPGRADEDEAALGGFGQGGGETRSRELGALARAGFPRDVAHRALDLSPAEAEALLLALKRA